MIQKLYELVQKQITEKSLTDYFAPGNLNRIADTLCGIERVIDQMHDEIREYTFKSVAEEIFFFKTVKPLIVKQHIIASWFKDIHERHTAYAFEDKTFIKKRIAKIERFLREESFFYAYIQRLDEHLDERYFTRLKQKPYLRNYYLFNYDRKITCSHGLLLAKIRAYEKIRGYCMAFMIKKKGYSELTTEFVPKGMLKWTGTKTEAAELVYALYFSGSIDYGDATVQKLVTVFDAVFQTRLETSIYRDFIDIKNRKKESSKFLNKLISRFNEQLNERFI